MNVKPTGSIILACLLALLCLVHERAAAQAGLGPRRFSVVRTSMQFGTVPLDSCRTDTLSIARRDTGIAVIDTITFNPKQSRFAAENVKYDQALPDRSVITFRYCPDDTLVDNAMVVVTYRMPGDRIWLDTVYLSGRGGRQQAPPPVVRYDSGSLRNVGTLFLGNVRPGSSSRIPIEVVNIGSTAAMGRLVLGSTSTAFTIDSVRRQGVGWGPYRTDPDSISVQSSIGLIVRYAPTRLGFDTTTLFFMVDGKPIRSLVLVGRGVGGVIVVPGAKELGKLRTDTCVMVTLPIGNDGNEPLVIRRVEFSNLYLTEESFPSLPDTIAAGGSHPYSFRFCPRDTGQLSATIEMISDALSGSGRTGLTAVGIAGRLAAEPVSMRRVTGDCDTLDVVVRNVGTAETRARVVELSRGDRGFYILDTAEIGRLLAPGESIRIRIRFCPTSLDRELDTLVVADRAGNLLRIPLAGLALRARMAALRLLSDGVPLKVCDFRDVPVGSSRSMMIYLRNTGNLAIRIERGGLATELVSGASTGGSFSIVPARSDTARLEIGVGSVDSVIITYRPSTTTIGSDSGVVTISGMAPVDGEMPQPVVTGFDVVGNGIRGSVGNRKIWITSGGDSVGRKIRLAVVVDPPITDDERLTRLDLRFNVDSRSLVPVDEGESDVVMEKRAGFWSVSRSGSVIVGDTIAHIAVVGLSTGVPLNKVALLPDPTLDGRSLARLADTSLVLLQGCGLGRTPGFRIKSRVSGVTIPSSADAATITYRVPAGAAPLLRMTDLDGALRLELELEPGTDADQTASIPLRGLGAGVYLLELRLDGDRSVIPIMIAR